MAEDLYPAQLDGYNLEIETLDDTFEKSIVRHEFPKKDGALLEDMGQKARTVTIRCYFWDHGDHLTYADHVDFINHLKSTQLSELIHPQYGRMDGMVERFAVRHDDRDLTAEVDIAFVENLRGDLEDVVYEDVEAVIEAAAGDAWNEQLAAFAADIKAKLGGEAVGILGKALLEGQSIYSQFQGFSQKAKSYIKQVDTLVTTLEADLTGIANPANSLVATIDFGVNLPGRVIGAVARCVERYIILNDSVKTAPARFLANLDQARIDLESRAGFVKELQIGFAIQAAQVVATVYKDDETARRRVRKSEQSQSFDTLGNYIGSATTETILTVTDLETSLAKIRTMIQQALDQDRSVDALKTMAASLLSHVNTIKLERDRIITVQLDNPMPLHLVCHRYGLDYHYAERINSINRIKNPNFTAGEVQIYGRPGGGVS